MGRIIRYDRIKPHPSARYRLDPGHWMAKASGLWLFNEGCGVKAQDATQTTDLSIYSDTKWQPTGIYSPDTGRSGAAAAAPQQLLLQPPITLSWRGIVPGAGSAMYNSPAFVGVSHSSTYTDPYFSYWLCRRTTQTAVTAYAAENGVAQGYAFWGSITYEVLQHYVCVITGTSVTLYVNGSLFQTIARITPNTAITYGSGSRVGVATHPTVENSNFINAVTESAAIYPFAPTPDQIREAYETPYSGFTRETPTYYSIPATGTIGSIFRSRILKSTIITEAA